MRIWALDEVGSIGLMVTMCGFRDLGFRFSRILARSGMGCDGHVVLVTQE